MIIIMKFSQLSSTYSTSSYKTVGNMQTPKTFKVWYGTYTDVIEETIASAQFAAHGHNFGNVVSVLPLVINEVGALFKNICR